MNIQIAILVSACIASFVGGCLVTYNNMKTAKAAQKDVTAVVSDVTTAVKSVEAVVEPAKTPAPVAPAPVAASAVVITK